MIIFHGVDMDGWFSAALLKLYDANLADYMVPADYKNEKDVVETVVAAIKSANPPKKIVIADFSFLPDAFKMIVNLAATKKISVSWFDHHVSSINKLSSIPEVTNLRGVRDTKISAAKLVCDYLGFDEKIKSVIQIVSDYDTFNFDETKLSDMMPALFNAGFNYRIEEPLKMVNRAIQCLLKQNINEYVKIGTYLLKHADAQVPGYVKDVKFGEFEGKKFAMVNVTERLVAQLAQKLFDKVDFVFSWKAIAGDKVQLFLTSAKTGNTDVSAIAQKMGSLFGGSGGGHKNASGATGQLVPFINYFYKN